MPLQDFSERSLCHQQTKGFGGGGEKGDSVNVAPELMGGRGVTSFVNPAVLILELAS